MHRCLNTGYWGYGNEYQKDDNLEAYKAVVGNGISFIDTSEVGLNTPLGGDKLMRR